MEFCCLRCYWIYNLLRLDRLRRDYLWVRLKSLERLEWLEWLQWREWREISMRPESNGMFTVHGVVVEVVLVVDLVEKREFDPILVGIIIDVEQLLV